MRVVCSNRNVCDCSRVECHDFVQPIRISDILGSPLDWRTSVFCTSSYQRWLTFYHANTYALQKSSSQCPLVFTTHDSLPQINYIKSLECVTTLGGCSQGYQAKSNGSVFVDDWVLSPTPTNQSISIEYCKRTSLATDLRFLWLLLVVLLVLLLGLIAGMVGWNVYRRRRRLLRETTEIPDLAQVDFSLQGSLSHSLARSLAWMEDHHN